MTNNSMQEQEDKKVVCELCGDTGEMDVWERVYPDEPYEARMKRACYCTIPRRDDEHDDR